MSGCACNSGIGDADMTGRRFPTVEKVFANYIRDCLKTGAPFYISSDLNSDALAHMQPHADDIAKAAGVMDDFVHFGQLEFIPEILAAIGSVATTVGSTVVAVAPSVASIAGTVSAIKTINAANSHLTQNGIAVPQAIAGQVVGGVQQDIGGIPTNTLLLVGGAALFLLLALKRR